MQFDDQKWGAAWSIQVHLHTLWDIFDPPLLKDKVSFKFEIKPSSTQVNASYMALQWNYMYLSLTDR